MSESITFSEGDLKTPPELRLLHYNDVYHVEAGSAEPVGGIARFQTVCKQYRDDAAFSGQPGLLTLFSGDAFNPSLESSVTKGSHMVPVLNKLSTDVACVGNHDLDFGTLILNASNGIKVGVIGLVEREWLATINALPPNLIYKSASATAIELVPQLRKQGAEIIIAVTHQREPNDNKLAEKTPAGLIDLILGGHDHFYAHKTLNGTHVLRSGTDFRQLSYIEARKKGDGSSKWHFHIVRRDITKDVDPDPEMTELSNKLSSALATKLDKPLGYTAAPLDARFTTVRLKESNYGNFVCDLMRHHYGGDCTLMAAGTIRGDQIYPPGVLRVKDIMTCFPFEDPCIVIKYPALEGRFPQVSNIAFEFDPNKPSGKRILWANVGDAPIDHHQKYTLVTRGYMGRGKDGFGSLLVQSEGGEAEEIVHEENGILISMLMRQYFMSLKILGQWKHWSKSLNRHWNGVHKDLHESHPVLEPKEGGRTERIKAFPLAQRRKKVPSRSHKRTHSEANNAERTANVEHTLDDSESEDSEVDHPEALSEDIKLNEYELKLVRKVVRKWWRLAGLDPTRHPACVDSKGEEELKVDWTKAIAPRLEGRIKIVGQEAVVKS
ncbi:Mannosylglucosyl-3-phosphoglycerate phosphatase [Cyphellophora attinorum]|uniref:Mannosylglucosyl-3-phosphoglycerate phosphatase n=1 Tax=Cyphellophora attinorum TaxID=1664694 RepID=A0A0N0NMS2_9EURO|nr:Mannosylglucosyl-3-phosphoglycerate phosphatase [Phialophora attinorum]KPI40539.1 Mannosylglucosyl-3-phosphoglycerate phosphatase [Phialophora attinorum]